MTITKYQSIYQAIKHDILEGNYQPNQFLESEMKLMEKYNASKDTIRKSLKLLEKEKLIKSVIRRGYICLNNEAFKKQVNELMYEKTNIRHKVYTFEKLIVSEELASCIGLKPLVEAFHIFRLTFLNEKPIFIDDIYISAASAPDLTIEICNQSIYDYFLNNNIQTDCKHRIFTTRNSTVSELEYLNLTSSLVIDVKRFTYDESGFVFEYSNSIFAPEYFEYFE